MQFDCSADTARVVREFNGAQRLVAKALHW